MFESIEQAACGPLTPLPEHASVTHGRRRSRYTLSLLKAKDLDPALEGELMDLVEANMRTLYEASAQGWNRDARLEDLRGSTSRILVLRDAADTPTLTNTGAAPLAAYCLFRMDTEYCDAKDPLKRHSGNKIEVAYW